TARGTPRLAHGPGYLELQLAPRAAKRVARHAGSDVQLHAVEEPALEDGEEPRDGQVRRRPGRIEAGSDLTQVDRADHVVGAERLHELEERPSLDAGKDRRPGAARFRAVHDVDVDADVDG